MKKGFLFSGLVACFLVPATYAERPPEPAAAGKTAATAQRLREGETVELMGRLALSGDRAVFYPAESDESLRVLENLALERITQTLTESRSRRQWIVTGLVTEYRGSNYILIGKAILKSGPLNGTAAPSP